MTLVFSGAAKITTLKARLDTLEAYLVTNYGPGVTSANRIAGTTSIVANIKADLDAHAAVMNAALTTEMNGIYINLPMLTGTASLLGSTAVSTLSTAKTNMLVAANAAGYLTNKTALVDTAQALWPTKTTAQFNAAWPATVPTPLLTDYDVLAGQINSAIDTLRTNISTQLNDAYSAFNNSLTQISGLISSTFTYMQAMGTCASADSYAKMQQLSSLASQVQPTFTPVMSAVAAAKAANLTGSAYQASITSALRSSTGLGTLTTNCTTAANAATTTLNG